MTIYNSDSKKNSSCSHVLFVFNESIRYFIRRGSRVHCVDLDGNTAFDKVLHYGLFYKMASRGISSTPINVLIFTAVCTALFSGNQLLVKHS